MTLQKAESKRIHALDGFRGIFALLVVLHHANNNTLLTNNFLIRNADLFVDYFFVLSGFIISYNYINRIDSTQSFYSFLKRRFTRLYPLLAYTTLLFFSLALVGKHFDLLNRKNDLWLETLDTLTFMNSTPVFGSTLGMNYPSWSISAEMISYIVFGLCILLFRRKAVWAVGLIFLLFLSFFVYHQEYLLFEGDYGFIRSGFCFFLGYFMYKFSKKYTRAIYGSAIEIAFLVLLLVAFKVSDLLLSSLVYMLFPFLFSLGIFIFINSVGVIHRFLSCRPVQFLGKISFSVYLNHALVLIVMERLLFASNNAPENGLPLNVAYLLLSITGTILYSYVTYHLIEVGLRDKWKAFTRPAYTGKKRVEVVPR